MLPATMRLLPIKDLKVLSVFFGLVTIDMQVLTDLKRQAIPAPLILLILKIV